MKKGLLLTTLLCTMALSISAFAGASSGEIEKTAYLNDNNQSYVLSYEVPAGALVKIENTTESVGPVNIFAESADGEIVSVRANVGLGGYAYYVAPQDETEVKFYVQRAEDIDGKYVGNASFHQNEALRPGHDNQLENVQLKDDGIYHVINKEVIEGALVTIYNTTKSPGSVNIWGKCENGELELIGTIAPDETFYYVSQCEGVLELFVQRTDAIDGLYRGIISVQE